MSAEAITYGSDAANGAGVARPTSAGDNPGPQGDARRTHELVVGALDHRIPQRMQQRRAQHRRPNESRHLCAIPDRRKIVMDDASQNMGAKPEHGGATVSPDGGVEKPTISVHVNSRPVYIDVAIWIAGYRFHFRTRIASQVATRPDRARHVSDAGSVRRLSGARYRVALSAMPSANLCSWNVGIFRAYDDVEFLTTTCPVGPAGAGEFILRRTKVFQRHGHGHEYTLDHHRRGRLF